MMSSETRCLSELEEEDGRLKHSVPDLWLDKEMLRVQMLFRW